MKKLISLLLAALMLLSLMTACKAKAPETINVYTLSGTTGFGMAKLMNDNTDGKYTFTNVGTNATQITDALINGDVDIAALPTNAAANLYNKTAGGVKILAVNTLGCLYLLTKEGITVSTFADLRGKTVYVPTQNPTFIFTDLCKKNNLIPGTDITLLFAGESDKNTYKTPEELADAIANEKIDIAVLPEPMVTIAMSKAKQNNVTLTNALDLTAEWNKVNPEGSLVQGCIVVRTAFLEEHPEAVAEFLASYKASITYLNENPAQAAQMIADNGIIGNATVAEKAIPKCNICYLDGNEMKAAMEVYLTILSGINPTSIGGKLPSDDFYYIAK